MRWSWVQAAAIEQLLTSAELLGRSARQNEVREAELRRQFGQLQAVVQVAPCLPTASPLLVAL